MTEKMGKKKKRMVDICLEKIINTKKTEDFSSIVTPR